MPATKLSASQQRRINEYNEHLEGVVVKQSKQLESMWSFLARLQRHAKTSDHTVRSISHYRTHAKG